MSEANGSIERPHTRTTIDHNNDNRFMEEVQKRLDILPDARAMARCDELEKRVFSIMEELGNLKNGSVAMSVLSERISDVQGTVRGLSSVIAGELQEIKEPKTDAILTSRVDLAEAKMIQVERKVSMSSDKIDNIYSQLKDLSIGVDGINSLHRFVMDQDNRIRDHLASDHLENTSLVKYGVYANLIVLALLLFVLGFQSFQ